MPAWLDAPDYQLTRLVIERALGLIYLLAFVAVLDQFPALLGERGLLPVPRFLRMMTFRGAPSLFHFGYSDRLLRIVGWTGVVLSAAIVLGLPQMAPLPVTMAAWFVLWVLYLSIVNVGQTFYSFGWESLLLEAGFLAIFLGNARTLPSFLVLLLFRWLAFRLELGAGLIKLRGDSCWRDLTCMDYHHETQPMPNPLSRYFHRLPRSYHRMEVVGNFVAQLVAPFLLFLPQPVAAIGGVIMLGTQAYLVVSGNYAWLNALTLVVSFAAIPDSLIRALLPGLAGAVPVATAPPTAFTVAVIGLTAAVVIMSYWPIRNMIGVGQRQRMNFSFNRYHLVNTYGAFGSVTRTRYEVVIEGNASEDPAEDGWREYEFLAKPGDVRRRPPQVAPYHLRLDWLMWFAALSPSYAEDWLVPFVQKLLEGDRAVLRLLRLNPFPDAPPLRIRARFYHYRFTTPEERRATGAWWSRELAGDYLPAVRLSGAAGARR